MALISSTTILATLALARPMNESAPVSSAIMPTLMAAVVMAATSHELCAVARVRWKRRRGVPRNTRDCNTYAPEPKTSNAIRAWGALAAGMPRSLLPERRNGAYLARNWNFESVFLQRTVRLSRDIPLLRRKAGLFPRV